MNKSDRLGKLFSAVGAKNWDSAFALAEEICAHEEHVGHTSVARLLRASLKSRPNGKSSNVNGASHSTVLSTLRRQKGKATLEDVFLKKRCKDQIGQLVQEWRVKEKLRRKGIPIRSKVLLHGPPGCGKSLTALAIGNELGLPTYLVRFDAVIGSYLGQTAINLRQIFQFAETTPCVLIMDEVDALGKKRGNPLDVGELDRIVISLMQELENSQPAGMFIATSNLPKHLDDALWRRFDLVVKYTKPSKTELIQFGKLVAGRYELKLTSKLRVTIESCRSFAEAEQRVQDVQRAKRAADFLSQ